ncbi:helix-turn-helix transcriptional regulator [Rudanella lutea]|uniref:helix-turn-helix transcriptional regulator n=1 Tax=Rudanella lutea TaxID=451374 RepID=UPI00037DFDB4|nr:WYL domain-containing protein [Rudanella lutea]
MSNALPQPYTDTQFTRLKRIHNALVNNALPAFKLAGEKNPNPLFDGFSERTFYNLLDTLRQLAQNQGAEIRYNQVLNRYECSKRFSLYLALFPDEKNLVSDMAAALDWVARLNEFEGLDGVFLKLEDRAGIAADSSQKAVVHYEQNPLYTGSDWLKPLYDLIRADHPALLTYTEFGREPVAYTFSPYLLKEYNNRWHIYGWAAEPKRLLNLALDRIDKLKPLPDLRRRPCDVDWSTYLTDVVGFTRIEGEPLREYRVRVWFPRAHYVLTKPLHHTQDIGQRTGEFIDFIYHLRWNRELEAALFELGPDAELLEPIDKRAAFAEKARALAGRYGW